MVIYFPFYVFNAAAWRVVLLNCQLVYYVISHAVTPANLPRSIVAWYIRHGEVAPGTH